jgi:hypothetical protein
MIRVLNQTNSINENNLTKRKIQLLRNLLIQHNRNNNEKFRVMDLVNITSIIQSIKLVNNDGEIFRFNHGILSAIDFLRGY